MKCKSSFTYKRFVAVAVFCMVSIFSAMITGQNVPTPSWAVDDWSQHHLVFSNPGTLADAINKGGIKRWHQVTDDLRYQMQLRRRSGTQRAVAAAPVESFGLWPLPTPSGKGKLKKDWSATLNGTAASLTSTIGTLSAASVSGSSILTVDGVAFDASPPVTATAMGSFTGNPVNGQTVTLGGSEVLTASLSTAATASITVGASFCIAPGKGFDIDGTTLTTNATAGSGTSVVGTVPSAGETVVIGGVTYTFETTLAGTTPANQVLVPTSNSSGNRTITAENLSVAINNTGTCGSTQSGSCTRNISSSNPLVSSTDNSNATQTLTSLCADNAAITGTSDGSKVTVNTVTAASSAGTNTTTTFALNTSGSSTTPASQTQTAANLITVINSNSTTSGVMTASSGGTGIVSLTANTWGTAANSFTLSDTATSGVTLSGSTFSGGVNGTNTGTSFAIDNVPADAATNLASAITRNGASLGVTGSSSGAGVTVTATAGSGGNAISLAEAANNFSWLSSSLTGGSDGTTSGTSSPPTFAYWSVNNYATAAAVAANIVTAINANTTLGALSTGVSATNGPSSNQVTVTANATGTGGNSYTVSQSGFTAYSPTGSLTGGGAGSTAARVQPNAYPAKFSFDTTSASCTDFVVYPTGANGGTGAATIIAYNNIYSSCSGSGPVPSVAWAYNTGTGDAVTTSPILSFDSTGSQVAFIQSNGSAASLVLLKWAAGPNDSITTPEAITTQSSGAAYQACNAPCMYTIAFSGGHNDSLSSPFYDYHGDALYVGDDSGNLHQFTGVFNGAPAENTASPWPVNLGSNKLASPVYDANWSGGQVFVGDLGGVMHCVTPSTGAIFGTSANLGGEIADAPLINSSANYVLIFVDSDTIYGYSEQFFPNSPGSVGIGTGGTGYYLYAGTFDNAYYESSNATGNIYVVGNTGVNTGATLYRVGLTGGFLNGTVASVVTGLTGSYPWASPATEFCNNGASACALQTASGCTLNATTTITCSTASFTSGDVGASVIGTDIPSGATISTVSSATKIIISAAASGSATNVALSIGATATGTDYLFFSVNRGTKTGCTNSAGNGCILSYNISFPGGVAESGSGLNVTTPTTNGCWATGGIVIDNSSTTGGASQIYFVNLNGIAAGNPTAVTTSKCTAGSTVVINAVQAAQSTP